MNILITGATGAIGKEISLSLAAEGHDLYLGCRSRSKGEQLVREIEKATGTRPEFIELNLADSSSVKKAVGTLSEIKLDGIIHNAGVMMHEFRLSADGHEETLTVNYRNTRLLTELLLPGINSNGHIVFTTSATRSWFPFQKITADISPESFATLRTYALSKKLITDYAAALSEKFRHTGLRVNCADPGVVDTPMLRMGKWYDRLTDMFFRPFCLSPTTGAKAAIRALKSEETGLIFHSPSGICRLKRKNYAVTNNI